MTESIRSEWAVMCECQEGNTHIDITVSFHPTVQEAYSSAWKYNKAQQKNKVIGRVWVAPCNKRFDVSYKYSTAFIMPRTVKET